MSHNNDPWTVGNRTKSYQDGKSGTPFSPNTDFIHYKKGELEANRLKLISGIRGLPMHLSGWAFMKGMAIVACVFLGLHAAAEVMGTKQYRALKSEVDYIYEDVLVYLNNKLSNTLKFLFDDKSSFQDSHIPSLSPRSQYSSVKDALILKRVSNFETEAKLTSVWSRVKTGDTEVCQTQGAFDHHLKPTKISFSI